MPHAEKVIFNDCGHFMAIDKPEETAASILNFFDRHCNYQVKQFAVPEFD
jgi:pimeloyl-ACP methyl ester carboxylesterase